MLKDKYLSEREELCNLAEGLINEGKIEEANAKMKEIEDLDVKFENEAKVMANLNALKDTSKISNVVPMEMNNKIGEIKGEELEMENSMEYRKAFMNYVTKGEAIPKEMKNAVTVSTEVGSVIPQTVMQRIIEKIENSGNLLQLITRTNYKGGVAIPTSDMKPVATWVAENVGSEAQKKTTGSITFGYFKLRCAIANSLEVETVTMDMFERIFVAQVSEAMIKALELSVVKGAGGNQPTGILVAENVSAVKTLGQNVDIAKNKTISYADLIKAESVLPAEYESGAVYVMSKKTFVLIQGLTDSVGQPLAKVNFGIGGALERTILGRRVVLCEHLVSSDATVQADEVVAFLFDMRDYVLNTNLNMTIKKYEDHTNDSFVTKAILLADGKVIDKNSLVTFTKKA